jgi:hypothetical protein
MAKTFDLSKKEDRQKLIEDTIYENEISGHHVTNELKDYFNKFIEGTITYSELMTLNSGNNQ